jgi:hypothetical protein
MMQAEGGAMRSKLKKATADFLKYTGFHLIVALIYLVYRPLLYWWWSIATAIMLLSLFAFHEHLPEALLIGYGGSYLATVLLVNVLGRRTIRGFAKSDLHMK